MTYTEKIVLASSEYFQNCMIEDPNGYIYLVLYISLLIAIILFCCRKIRLQIKNCEKVILCIYGSFREYFSVQTKNIVIIMENQSIQFFQNH